MVTFTVRGQEGKVYRYAKGERGFTFGSLLDADGKAKRGRPSKFPNDQVILSEPLPENTEKVEEVEKKEEVQLPLPEEGNGDAMINEGAPVTPEDTFIPLE